MISLRATAAVVTAVCAFGIGSAPLSRADPPAPAATCVALGQISESLSDDIGQGLQPAAFRRYSITKLTHGVSYMRQVNSKARITALDGPLQDLTNTIDDLKTQYELVTTSNEDGTWHPMSETQTQDLDQASAQQDVLTGLVSQLQQSNHCPT